MSTISNLIEKFTGRAKKTAGEALDNEKLRKEGEAQEQKAEAREDAERLEEVAEEKQQKAAGYKGQEKAQQEKKDDS